VAKKEKLANKVQTNRWLAPIGLILSIIGICDATYLTITHYTTAIPLACPDTGFINCAKVTTSQYSMIHGIPVAVLGLFFFVTMAALQLPVAWRSTNKYIRLGRLGYSIIGLLTAFWLIFVEFHKLDSICLFCTAAHILSFSIFVLTVIGTSITSENSAQTSTE
jgi:uncharacterized membrane protein